MTKHKTKLLECLAEVEKVFGKYVATFPLSVSVTITSEMQHALEHDSYNMLPRYVFHALTTWGDVNDFKAFLPAVLRMLAFDISHLWTADTLIRKLENPVTGVRDWPDNEKVALSSFFFSLWQYALDAYPPEDCIEAKTLIVNVLDPQPYLDLWDKRLDEVTALRHLAAWIVSDYGILTTGKNAIGVSAIHNAWVLRASTQSQLENAYLDHMNEPFADEFSEAAQNLFWIHDQMDENLANLLGIS